MDDLLRQFVLLWAVIDPIGTIPVFIAVTIGMSGPLVRKVAVKATLVAALVLIFFVLVGEYLLDAMQIPLSAFQIAGGIILFLFALTMIFGESKPETELHLVDRNLHKYVFPLAIPSIASPGAMMAAVLLTDNHRFSWVHQGVTTLIILTVLLITLIFMLLASRILNVIGDAGASVVSRVMGMILASIAVSAVLNGISSFFNLSVGT
jgi:multiple antibiotic resistance protein